MMTEYDSLALGDLYKGLLSVMIAIAGAAEFRFLSKYFEMITFERADTFCV